MRHVLIVQGANANHDYLERLMNGKLSLPLHDVDTNGHA